MKVALSLCFVILLAACAPATALTPSPSTLKGTRPVGESSTPAATRTPVPPTATATATPRPQLTLEDLKSMSVEDKLKMAPQAESAPEDVVSSFAAGESARDIAWSGKSLTFWDRVVAYEGTTRSGEKVTLYYDLESGQWAKQYQNFDEVSKIPADEVPDVMVVNDENGAHLVRNKLQYDYDWISQPQVMIEGKMVFRDEKGYPKAIWDTNAKKWLRSEETDIPWTREKWEKVLSQYSWIGDDGIKRDGSIFLKSFPNYNKVMTSRDEIEKLPVGMEYLIFNRSGEIIFWSSQEEAAKRFDEGAIVQVFYERLNSNYAKHLLNVAFQQWEMGNKNIFLTFGDVGVSSSEIVGRHGKFIIIYLEDIPQVDDGGGHIVSPVMRLPKHGIPFSKDLADIRITISNPVFWLDEYIRAGAIAVEVIYVPQ